MALGARLIPQSETPTLSTGLSFASPSYAANLRCTGGASVETQHLIQKPRPLLHRCRDTPFRPTFCQVEESINKASHIFQLSLGKIVLTDGHIASQDFSVRPLPPTYQPHVRALRRCTRTNQFRRSAPMHRVVQIVLHRGKKDLVTGASGS